MTESSAAVLEPISPAGLVCAVRLLPIPFTPILPLMTWARCARALSSMKWNLTPAYKRTQELCAAIQACVNRSLFDIRTLSVKSTQNLNYLENSTGVQLWRVHPACSRAHSRRSRVWCCSRKIQIQIAGRRAFRLAACRPFVIVSMEIRTPMAVRRAWITISLS